MKLKRPPFEVCFVGVIAILFTVIVAATYLGPEKVWHRLGATTTEFDRDYAEADSLAYRHGHPGGVFTNSTIDRIRSAEMRRMGWHLDVKGEGCGE